MKMYLAKWPNGDVSIVAATSVAHRDDLLDEVGDPSPSQDGGKDGRVVYQPIKEGFAIHLKINPEYKPHDEDEDSYPFLSEQYHFVNEELELMLDSVFEEQKGRADTKYPARKYPHSAAEHLGVADAEVYQGLFGDTANPSK